MRGRSRVGVSKLICTPEAGTALLNLLPRRPPDGAGAAETPHPPHHWWLSETLALPLVRREWAAQKGAAYFENLQGIHTIEVLWWVLVQRTPLLLYTPAPCLCFCYATALSCPACAHRAPQPQGFCSWGS